MSETVEAQRPSQPTPALSGGTLAAARTYSASLVVLSHPAEAAAEAVRALRTDIMAQHIHLGRRALAVCGASLNVGCTFVATNLAVSLAQIGVKTLLIDANMRSPGVDFLIKPKPGNLGLAQCLGSPETTFTACVDADVLPYLSIMYAGGVAKDAQELLAGERFNELMDFCLRDFDVTIVDTPPANSCADARRISTVVGYSLLVARRDKTFVDDLRILTGQLEASHARVVGTVLNRA
jgi:capsular exopolysaccharide synthesis family protein